MGFRLFPSFHPRHHLRRTVRLGPLRTRRRGGRQLRARCGSLVVERNEPATHARHSRSRVLAEPGAESAPVAERPTRASRHTAIASAGSAGSPSALPEGLPALAVGTGLHVLAAIVDDDVAAACG
jgi:hypothetical protein